MGIIAWIALGMAVGLLANVLLPGPAAGLPPAHQATGRPGGFTRRWDIHEGSP
jgi:hypothetical protein